MRKAVLKLHNYMSALYSWAGYGFLHTYSDLVLVAWNRWTRTFKMHKISDIAQIYIKKVKRLFNHQGYKMKYE